MKKTLHYINPITKEYLETKEIDTAYYGLNIPNTTESDLLPHKNGFARVFKTKICEYVEDNRTKDIHNIQTKQNSICDYLGPLKTNFKLGKYIKTQDELLADAKVLKTEKINQACEKSIISGFTSTALGTVHTYQSDRDDQINLMGLVTSEKDDLLKCKKESALAEWKPHTIAQLKKVFTAGATHKKTQLIKASTLKSQINNMLTVKEINEVIW